MPPDPPARPRLPWSLLGLAGAVAVADQVTKGWIQSALEPGQAVAVIPGWFQLRLIMNRGGLFGVLRDLPEPWRSLLFSGIPIVASVGLILFLARTTTGQRLLRLGLALILGGAVGNLTDRLRLGHVVDFLDVHLRDHHWPAFNLADSAICIGVGLILLDAFHGRPAVGAEFPEHGGATSGDGSSA